MFDQFEDRVAEFGKPGFIFCHDVSFIHNRIMVEIVCAGIDSPTGFFCFFEGEVEQAAVVCLEFY